MNNFIRLFLVFLFILSNFIVFSQEVSVNDSLKIESFIKKTSDYLIKREFDNAIVLIDSATSIVEKTNSNFFNIKLMLAKSSVLRSSGKLDEATEITSKAKELAKKSKHTSLMPDALFEEANIYFLKGELNQVNKVLAKALVLYEKNNNQKGIAKAYTFFGVINGRLGEYEKALEYLHKAYAIHHKLNDKNYIRFDLLNIGTTYFHYKKYVQAKKYFFKVIPLVSEDDLYIKNTLYLNLATIYQHLKQLDSSYYYQNKAIKLLEKSNDEYSLSSLYYNAATVKYQQNDLDSTQYFAEKAINFAKKYKRYNNQIGGLLILSQVDSIRNNKKAELNKIKRVLQLKDSLIAKERKGIAKEMEEKYANYKKDEIIALQENNLKIEKDKNQLLQILILSSGFLILISLLFAITYRKLVYKNKKLHQIEKENISTLLNIKKQELVAIALQVEQKNNLIENFYKKLQKALNSTNEQVILEKELKKMLYNVKSSMIVQKDIKIFSEKFVELHHDFISIIKKEYPSLSIKEINFLSFIKVGLSTKQISAMQNITPSAVHKMRYRIKKKLQLKKELSLDDFIHRIN